MRSVVTVFAMVSVLAAACTTIAPAASPVASAGASAVPSLATPATPATSTIPTNVIPSLEPTAVPTDTTTPTKKPKPSATAAGPALPNLVITKFTASADPIPTGAHTDGRVTIKNTGTADAATFDLGISDARVDGLGGGAFSPVTVDGLAAGDSVQVTVNLSLSDPGDYTLTAEVDVNDAITESNEDDNTKTLSATAVSLPNLLPENLSGGPDNMVADYYVLEYTISNTGSAAADNFSVLTFDYAPDGTMDTIDRFVVTTPLEPGDHLLENYDVHATQSGTYRVYASIDPDNTVAESDETDNEAGLDVSMP